MRILGSIGWLPAPALASPGAVVPYGNFWLRIECLSHTLLTQTTARLAGFLFSHIRNVGVLVLEIPCLKAGSEDCVGLVAEAAQCPTQLAQVAVVIYVRKHPY